MAKSLQNVRERVRELLEHRHMTDTAFSVALGHKPSWASMFLSGKRAIPFASLDKIADLLQADPRDLISPEPLRQTDGESLKSKGTTKVEGVNAAQARLLQQRLDQTRSDLEAVRISISRLVDDLSDRQEPHRTKRPQTRARRLRESTGRRPA